MAADDLRFIAAILEQLAPHPADKERLRAIANDAPATRNCEACAEPFVPADPRQRFCSSTCGNRARSRRYRAGR
jgi:hypothetical protein